MIRGAEALRFLAELRTEELVVSTMTTARLWPLVSTRKDLDLPISNCMGKASSVALGLAIGRPERDVWLLDGDGSLAMNLGVLLSVAQVQPRNLVYFVFDDGVYTTVGGSPVPAARTADYAAMALGAGFPTAATFDVLEMLLRELPLLMKGARPLFVRMLIEHWDGLGEYGPMTQQVMDDRLIAAAHRFWAFRHGLTGMGPERLPVEAE
ncbi:MAG: thiamine pyrophosphate-dependent enzyme [Chloroflexi bacterium]|nr:thiamine pyrophosphate-dependent enzyme [Chloroflexota bacterium]